MENWKYKMLEELLGELYLELNHRFLILPQYLHDGYYISIYDNTTREIKDEVSAATIEGAVLKIQERNRISQPVKTDG